MLLASGVRAGRGVVRFARELFFFNLSIHGRADVSLFVECPPPRFALSSGEHMPTQQHAWWRPRLRSLAAVRSDHTEHCGVGHPRDACFYILSTWSSMISVGFRHLSTKWLCHSTPPGGSDAFTRYPGGGGSAVCGVHGRRGKPLTLRLPTGRRPGVVRRSRSVVSRRVLCVRSR